MGIEIDRRPAEDAFLYSPIIAYASSVTITGLCILLHRYKIISGRTAVPVASLAVGKAVAIFIDLKLGQPPPGDKEEDDVSLLLRVLDGGVVVHHDGTAIISFSQSISSPIDRVRFLDKESCCQLASDRTVIAYRAQSCYR
jgi:hypothetical protein